MNVIIGTAGHIDHGKTALVRALTGVDADRLPEEKQRGITIDLGFAELRLGDIEIGFVDVPGHERFVRNMLAGAGGIDVVLLVVAADEGVMPQTREHFEICRLLGTKAGIVVLTKRDLVDEETLELAKLDVAELTENSFLQNAPVVAVSAKDGAGLDELRSAIESVVSRIPRRPDRFVARLPIDRSFTIKGFGPVVTGTLLAGEIATGTELELLPDKKRVRVRGVQTQGRVVDKAAAGQRTAINLGGIDHSELTRGMVLAEVDAIEPTQIIDTVLEVVPSAKRPVRSRQRIRFHLGAVEVLGRVSVLNEAGEVAPGDTEFVQLRLELPVAALPGDRYIIRSYSPQATIAGGEVLDAHARRHRRSDLESSRSLLKALARSSGEPAELCRLFIEAAGAHALSIRGLRAKTGFTDRLAAQAITKLSASGTVTEFAGFVIANDALTELRTHTLAFLKAELARDPLSGGVPRERIRDEVFAFIDDAVFSKVIGELQSSRELVAENELLKLPGRSPSLSAEQTKVLEGIRAVYRPDNYAVPKLDDAIAEIAARTKTPAAECRKLFQMSLRSGEIEKVSAEFYFNAGAIASLVAKLNDHASRTPDRSIDVPAFKEMAGISRKYAIPLLEYFDSKRITVRQGDKRRVA
jgi:selenocysteine-specific elongation factor